MGTRFIPNKSHRNAVLGVDQNISLRDYRSPLNALELFLKFGSKDSGSLSDLLNQMHHGKLCGQLIPKYRQPVPRQTCSQGERFFANMRVPRLEPAS